MLKKKQIPLILVGTLEENLNLSSDAFKAKFGRDKPSVSTEVIFHCKMGGRAQKGADLANKLGFEKYVFIKLLRFMLFQGLFFF
jgi:rhodanese-related sulfurtransferase